MFLDEDTYLNEILTKPLQVNSTPSNSRPLNSKEIAELAINQRFLVDAEIMKQNAEMLPLIKNISLKPHNIFIGNWTSDEKKERTTEQRKSEKNLKDNKPNKDFSKKSCKSLGTALNWLEAGAEWTELVDKETGNKYYMKTNLITLTVPSTVGEILPRSEAEAMKDVDNNGNELKYSMFDLLIMENLLVDSKVFSKMINHFLTVMTRKYKLHNYIWKKEPQKNGQLHIHINTDTFIDWRDIRKEWNHILRINGLLENYNKTFGNFNPNSTDVHSIRNSNNSVAYIAKYMLKNPNFTTLPHGKIWSCSKNLMPKHKVKCQLKRDDFREFGVELLKLNFEFKPVMVKDKISAIETKLGTIFLLKNHDWKKIVFKEVKQKYIDHVIFIKSGREFMPSNYYQMDMFSPETITSYNIRHPNNPIRLDDVFIDKNQTEINFDF